MADAFSTVDLLRQIKGLFLDAAGNPQLNVKSGDGLFAVSAAFARPADTAAYAVGDRVANATSAAAVLELTGVARAAGEAARIERASLRKSGTTLTNASFRVHLFRTLPTVSANDNGVFNAGSLLSVADIAGHVGMIDITMEVVGAVGARGAGIPTIGGGITFEAAGSSGHEASLWAVIEATGAYAPASGEIFTLTLEGARS